MKVCPPQIDKSWPVFCGKFSICQTKKTKTNKKIGLWTKLNLVRNKKVLLRECKRHTARHVASTPYVVLTGYPPGQGTPHPDLARGAGGYLTRVPPQPGYPPARVPPQPGYPPSQGTPRPGNPPGQGTPQGTSPAIPWHSGKCCKALWDTGTPQLPHGILGSVAKHYGIRVLPPCEQTNKLTKWNYYLPVVLRTRAVKISYMCKVETKWQILYF